MELGQQALSVLAVAAVALAAASLALALVLGRRLARVRSRRDAGEPDATREIRRIANEVGALRSDIAALRGATGNAVQRIGLVRFDAFEDMGGRLSFAMALLDADGSGVVLSSINGRNETRIYAKPIERGQSRYNLSDEEEEAIRRALGAPREGAGTARGRRGARGGA